MYWRKFQRISISTHSLTRRLTHTCVRCSMRHWHFNSQPHKEADVIMQSESYHHLHFNSQPHKEADTGCDEYNAERVLFQLTASQGG